MTIAVLGPGGVGGLVAGALARAGEPVVVVAREPTAAHIEAHGLRVNSVRLGEFVTRPRAVSALESAPDVLVVATKARGLEEGLQRIRAQPALALPLLNGLDHIAVLRRHFGAAVVAGSIRVEADRPSPGVIVHTSPFLRVDMASQHAAAQEPMRVLARTLSDAGVPAQVLDSEAQVMWSKLVRLNALACTTSAYDKLLGEIRSTPELRADLRAAIEEACAVARAEGARDADPRVALAELDAIPGAVLRAAARHGLVCPTVERLVAMIAARAPAAAATP